MPPPAAKSGEGGRPDTPSRTDDSYEAALRAADALFSPQRDKSAQPSSDDLGGDAAEATGRDPAGRGSGRILRVLDEPSPDPMDELERQRAPKRRGRKPGSKNRPKPDRAASVVATPGDADGHPAATHRMSVAGTDPADLPAAHVERLARQDAAHAAADPVTREATTLAPIPSRERRRFPWVRTKLKPGQEWKRRLPKVCW